MGTPHKRDSEKLTFQCLVCYRAFDYRCDHGEKEAILYQICFSGSALWRERNKVKHGDKLLPMIMLKKLLDKGVRNKLSLLRSK